MPDARTNLWKQRLLKVAPPVALVAGSLVLFAYLLRRFPYDGLYGVDGYTYYYQARALWEEFAGVAPRSFELFTSDGLQHWPVGYHLHVIAGFLLSGVSPKGGWILTILFSALCPAVLYLIVQQLFKGLRASAYLLFVIVTGLLAGALLPLNATFTRIGLSLMSDTPTCFWALVSVYLFIVASSGIQITDSTERMAQRKRNILYALAGFAFGVAVLIRYGTVVLALPIVIYLLLAAWPRTRTQSLLRVLAGRLAPVLWAVPLFLIALVPQVMYLMTHDPGTGSGDFLGSLNLSNMFATTTTSPDGTSTYDYPMVAFYLLGPIWQTQAGFYSPLFIPCIAAGIYFLLTQNYGRVLVFLLSWWLIPALLYSATPYQAHRFVIIYLPAIAILVGCGIGYGVHLIVPQIRQLAARSKGEPVRATTLISPVPALLGAALLALFAVGLFQCWNSVRDWVATHSAWEQGDRNVVKFVEDTATAHNPGTGQPWTVTLGLSAPLYHETQWPVLELFFADPETLAKFLAGPELHLAVVPETSLAGQWANTPTGDNWRWLNENFNLERVGQQGAYTVFIIRSQSGSDSP